MQEVSPEYHIDLFHFISPLKALWDKQIHYLHNRKPLFGNCGSSTTTILYSDDELYSYGNLNQFCILTSQTHGSAYPV